MGRELRRVPPDWRHPLELRAQLVVRDASNLDGFRDAFARPRYEMRESHKPLLDQSLREAQEEWDRNRAEFEASDKGGERWTEEDEQWARERGNNDGTIRAGELKYPRGFVDYEGLRPPQWDDNGTVRVADWYRPDWPEETRTAFQVYETVSEGTPRSPVFATEEELLAWLSDQTRDDEHLPHMSEEAARTFVRYGSVPSLMVVGGRMASNVEMLEPEFDPRRS